MRFTEYWFREINDNELIELRVLDIIGEDTYDNYTYPTENQ
jgi:hypothetical protein